MYELIFARFYEDDSNWETVTVEEDLVIPTIKQWTDKKYYLTSIEFVVCQEV